MARSLRKSTSQLARIRKDKLAAGKTAKPILISCGARLAIFDIHELRENTAYGELELDTIGDRKTARFLIMSDMDSTFNFPISMGAIVSLLKSFPDTAFNHLGDGFFF